MRARLSVLAAVALALGLTPLVTPALASPPAGAAAPVVPVQWKPRPATYGVVKQQNVEIRMDDGVKLSANVIRPAGQDGKPAPGRFPVILTQTAYNKEAPGLNMEDDYMVQRGYIQVLVDARGTGSSEGGWTAFGPREKKDSCELAAWAVKVPGSDGRLALDGGSYGGINQLFTAACHPKGLRAIFPVVPMGDAYRDVTVSGGETDTAFIPSWMGLVTGAGLLTTSVTSDPGEGVTAFANHVTNVATFQLPTVASAALGQEVGTTDGEFDGKFYKDRSPLDIINKVGVPTFIVGGEYDLFQRGEPMLYNALRARGVPARLLIGPWTHLDASSAGTQPLELRWFDHYVRGVKDPTLDRDIPPVTVYRLGLGKFVTSSSYPIAGTRYTSQRLPSGSKAIPYLPIAGVCSSSTSQWTAGGVPMGLPACTGDHSLNDKLGATYDFPVRGKPLLFNGTSMARLFVSTTRSDAFITARLEDLSPSGQSTPITNGWQMLSLRKVDPKRSARRNGMMIQPWHPDTRGSVEKVQPGKVYELDVEIFPTAAQIPVGDSLRLAIQTSDEPHLTPSLPSAVNQLGGTVTVYSSAKYPSALVFGRG
ncbi:MAG TPA: CocE/NonD family hydrolase [Mycobacteriales bacterium]|nr:CocE/NonD family hydrolase [Mycobacteriales bacterium]